MADLVAVSPSESGIKHESVLVRAQNITFPVSCQLQRLLHVCPLLVCKCFTHATCKEQYCTNTRASYIFVSIYGGKGTGTKIERKIEVL